MTQSQRRKVAWITGASSGIGLAFARKLVENGWLVAASARDADKLHQAAKDINRNEALFRPYPADVTDPTQVRTHAQSIARDLGPIDLLVLNAGTHHPMPATKFSAEVVRRLFDVNVMGAANAVEIVLPSMLARRSGRIMIVASLAGYVGLPTAAAYGATKAALINMTEALRAELKDSGVTVQLVNPGFVKTPLTDKNDFHMPFLISADQAARAMMAGLASERFEIAFPWAFATIMKLLRSLPYWLYFAIAGRMRGDAGD